jgi:P-type E1-E2 ATPase
MFLFCLAIISYCILIAKLHKDTDAGTLVLKFFDLITITVPPGLPVSMTFGIVFALEKLVKKQIYCSSPNKVVLGGMINWICFDKTGTLTEDFMDFHCLILSKNKKFSTPIFNVRSSNNVNGIVLGDSPALLKNKDLT